MDLTKLESELAEIIIDGENIESGYKILRDYFVLQTKDLFYYRISRNF
jgi:hypothetical protein